MYTGGCCSSSDQPVVQPTCPLRNSLYSWSLLLTIWQTLAGRHGEQKDRCGTFGTTTMLEYLLHGTQLMPGFHPRLLLDLVDSGPAVLAPCLLRPVVLLSLQQQLCSLLTLTWSRKTVSRLSATSALHSSATRCLCQDQACKCYAHEEHQTNKTGCRCACCRCACSV